MHRAYLSIGTLGGGNHFIEVDRDDKGSLYLVVHSGSRHLGVEVAAHYHDAAYRANTGDAPYELAYLTGEAMTDYILHAVGASIAAFAISMMFDGNNGPIATGLLAVGLTLLAN